MTATKNRDCFTTQEWSRLKRKIRKQYKYGEELIDECMKINRGRPRYKKYLEDQHELPYYRPDPPKEFQKPFYSDLLGVWHDIG